MRINFQNTSQLLSLFVTTEYGIQTHDIQSKPSKANTLIHVSVPFLYFLKNVNVYFCGFLIIENVYFQIESDEDMELHLERQISRLILQQTLREFVGIDVNDRQVIESMLNFNFYLCVGQMDNAFKAIKFIRK